MPNSTRLPERNLDILRAIAVLCVVASHVIEPLTRRLGAISVFQIGRIGVLMFFVHTSLVLMASLERLDQRIVNRWKWVKAFYIRRAFRIYPLAIVTVIFLLTVHMPSWYLNRGPNPTYTSPNVLTVISNLLLVQNLTYTPDLMVPLWTLPIEVQMYLVLPILYLLARRSWTALFTVLGIAIVAGFAIPRLGIPGIGRLNFLMFGPCFIAGVIAYRLLRTTSAKLSSWTWPVALLLISAVFVLPNPTVESYEVAWPFCLLLGFAIPYIKEIPESWLTRVASTIAKYSYGIYLTHVIILWVSLVVFYSAPLVVKALIFVICVPLTSFLAYHLIEAPGIALGVRMAEGKRIIPYRGQASEFPAP